MRFTAIALACALAASAQGRSTSPTDRDAIVAAALDYAEGYFGGEPARMTRAVSPFLSKRNLVVRPGVPPFLLQMNADTLIDASHGAKLPAAERKINAEVLDVTGDAAAARVFTAQFNDYLHLIKRNGSWQILNVLWHPPPAAGAPAGDRAAVERAARAYVTALYGGDGKGALAVLHPLANLRTLAQPPQNRPRVVRELNPDTLAASLAAGQVKPAGSADQALVTILGIDADIAAAKIAMGAATVYLHLGQFEGGWRVVNSLTYQ